MTAEPVSTPSFRPAVRADLSAALRAGLTDFLVHPIPGLIFASVYIAIGYAIFASLFIMGEAWLAIPFVVAFPLIAPFAAAGLYEVSRRRELGESVTLRAVMLTVWRQRGRDMGWMAFTVLFVLWIWIYQVRFLLAIFLSRLSFSSLDGFVNLVFQTSQGWAFLVVGTIVGGALATALFSLTVIAMPLLLDRDVDFITAMIRSVQTVLASPFIMLAWGLLIAALLVVSMAPGLLGLLVTLPVFGHATWHLYRRLGRKLSEV
ncbi:MAG: DUF2189 domain-containing protein [Pseudomonadota bacterium]